MSETNLTQASHEWANRPADERFATLEDLYLHTLTAATNATTADALMGQLEVVPDGKDLKLVTPNGVLGFNNWSFSQFSNKTGTSAGSVTDLPVQLAADTLNYRIKRNEALETQLYFDSQTKIARAVTSQSYGRILNHEVVRAVIELPGKWVVPPARPAKIGQPGTRLATEADVLANSSHPGMGIKVGDAIAPAGLYGSDRDVFAFLIDPETRINDGTEGGLSRGFFVRNSEVGNASFELITFNYRFVCGNHICWGVEDVEIVKIKHVGDKARERAFDKMRTALKAYNESSADAMTSMIKRARDMELGGTYEDVLDLVFGQKKLLAKNKVKAAYDKASEFADIDGSPRSVWGFAQGLTRISQDSAYTDERTALDRAAGKILAFAE
jgi:hypothetical protein